MKGKKILVAIVSVALLCVVAVFSTACDPHSHSYTETVVKPTCTEQGYTEYKCSCGDFYQDLFVDKLGHTEVTEIPETEPDCTNFGYTAKIVCDVCGDTVQERTQIPAKGHDQTSNPCIVCGSEYETEEEQFEFTLKFDDTYSIKAKNPSMLPKRIVVPSSYQGKAVSEIEESAFENAVSVESIKIPSGVIKFGSKAFSGCVALKNINIPSSVTELKSDTFADCSKLIAYCEIKITPSGWADDWASAINSFVTDVVEFGVTNDGFEWAKLSINIVTVSRYVGAQNVVKIPAEINGCVVGAVHDKAFADVDEIISLEIPDSITSIGDKAFSGCDNLKEVVLPENIENIGEDVFDLCALLEKILFKGDEELWVTLKAELFGDELVITITVYYFESENPDKPGNYWGYDGDNAQIYPPHVHTPVEDKAVEPDCKNTGLTAGSHCDVCKEVLVKQEVVPTKPHTEVPVKSVEPTCEEKGKTAGVICDVCKKVISGCEEIPANGHTEIEDKAVEPTCTTSGLTAGIHCDVCKKVLVKQEVVPARHNFVDGECEDCGEIQPTDDSYFTYTLLSDDTYSIKANNVSSLPKNVIIPSTYNGKAVTVIENSAFERNTMYSVRIPSSITKLGSRSFFGSWFLESVVFDDKSNLKIIEKQAFYESTKLVSVNIPNGVTIIEKQAFYYCGLLEIVIPNSLTDIGNSAFYNNVNLRKVTFEQNSQLTKIGDYAFRKCGIIKIEIPLSVTTMGEFVFEDCGNIIICCEAPSKPSGWANYWNIASSKYDKYSIIWDCKNQ